MHATLIDTSLAIHDLVFGPLAPVEAARYHRETTRMAELLGVPLACQPPDLPAFRRYVAETTASLEVTPTALRLAEAVLHPPLPRAAAPVAALQRLVTAGLLPPSLRRQYGLRWTPAHSAAFAALTASARIAYPRLPGSLRHAPAWFMVAPTFRA